MTAQFDQRTFRRKRLRFMAHCHRAWSRNLIPLVLLILLQWPILLWGSYHRYLFSHVGVMVLDSILVISGTFYFMAMIEMLPNRKPYHRLLALVLSVVALLFVLEVFAIWQYGTLFGEGLMMVILETNPAEAVEYLYSVRGRVVTALALSLLLGCLAHRLHGWWHGQRKRLSRKIFVLLQPEMIGVFLATIYIRPIGGEATFDLPLTQIISAVIQTREDMGHYEELRQSLSGEEVKLLRNEGNIPYVVLILGESTQRNLMHLYGYPLPNTPNLDALAGKGELAVFRDVISAKQGTVLSLREIFTFHDAESGREWYQCNNLLDVLREAGYKTWWLSNQDSFGVWGNTGALLADRADGKVFTQHRASQDDFGLHDEALFPLLDKALNESSGKNFFVLHLMGCHVLYELRYPAAFERFTAKEIAGAMPSDWKEDVAAYANAVFYNDFIVSSIMERFRDKDSVVIYISDHGENVHDEGSDLLGHAYGEPNRYLYEIPFMVWASDTFRQNHPEKWIAIQGAVSRPFMTDDLIHALIGLMDIRTEEYDPRKNIFAPEFDVGRKRIVSGSDYDTELRHLKIDK